MYKIDAAGQETELHSFTYADGAEPYAGVIRDAAGNLYGTTYPGGASDAGTVYKIDSAGLETVLHSFGVGTDGSVPNAGVIRDAAGNLYGSTNLGGASGAGTVYKIDFAGQETVLHNSTGTDGADPHSRTTKTARAGTVKEAACNV